MHMRANTRRYGNMSETHTIGVCIYMDAKEAVYEKLKELGIEFGITEHKAVFTIEEMSRLPNLKIEDVCKNLFLRDERGKKHFLVVMCEEKQADLKKIREQLGSSRLSFASEERLGKYLGLTKGSVTPLGIFNDKNCEVELLIDGDLKGRPRLGFHPNENTATVWISFDSLEKIIGSCGNRHRFIQI